MKIKKNDTVLITSGDDKGKKGKVIHVDPVRGKLQVEGVNIQKKHVRPKKEGEKGQVVEKPGFLSIGKVKMLCPRCNKASRVGYKLTEKGKQRICKKCSAAI